MWSNTLSRSSLAVVVAIIFIIVVVLFHNPDRQLSDERAHLNSQITASLDAIKNDLDTDLQHLAYSTLFIVDQARLHNPFGSSDDTSIFAEDFISLLTTSAFFDQLRLIDSQGMERIRANYNGGDPSLSDDDQLQNKSSRYYFQDTMKLAEHEVFLSPLDLNIENGRVEQPFKPTLRIGMPSFNYRGEKEGIIMINVLAAALIKHFSDRAKLVPAQQVSWLNGDGYWFAGEEESKLWGFMYESTKNNSFAALHPQIWKSIATAEQGTITAEGGTYLYTTISPYDAFSHAKTMHLNTARPYKWKIIAYYSDDFIHHYTAEKRFSSQLIMLLSGLLLVAIFLLFGFWYRQHLIKVETEKSASKNEQERLRMKSTGIIAGGIAHEFNNILSAVTANLYLLRTNSGDPERNMRALNSMDRLVERATRLVKYLLTFSRHGFRSNEQINLSKLAATVTQLAIEEMPERYQCEINISPDIEIIGDNEKVSAMLKELISNADDAIKNSAQPQLSVKLEMIEKNFESGPDQNQTGSFAMITVKDNGIGISEENLPHIYDPFFTTKEPGKGTGLGLSAVLGTVKVHHGEIEIESRENQGSEIRVYLPLSPQESPSDVA